MDGLHLFLAVHAKDFEACCNMGEVPRRYVGNRPYVGLREIAEDALQRAIIGSHEPVNKHTHMLLRVHFTPHGLAHYCTCITSAEHWFSPLLTKKLFPGDPTDWRVWHFHGDLPLQQSGPDGIAYLSTEWMQIE